MPTIHYYGKKTNFVGKTLFEILANLKNFGVNRMVVKQEELLKNPGQKCYYIVKKVEPVMDDKLEQGAIYAEQIFRGAKVPGLVFVDDETWHPDWQLISREEEDKYRVKQEELLEHGHPNTIKVLPRWMEVPPLMDIFLKRHIKSRRGVTTVPVKTDTKYLNIRMHYEFSRMNRPHMVHRTADENETSDENINLPIKLLLQKDLLPSRVEK